MTDNLIIIKGGAYKDIKKALRQWIALYSKDLQNDLAFLLFKDGNENHVIQADKRLDNERFYYLINYLKYPEGIEHQIDIEGYTIGKDKNQLKEKELLVYISSAVKEYDNVFVITSKNESFKIDFGGKITETKENKIFKYPTKLNMEYPETIKASRKEAIQKEEKNNEAKLKNRFKVLAFAAVSLLLIGMIINYFDLQVFQKFSFFLGMAIGLWFFADYKMLQSDKLYLYCLVIAIGYLFFIITNNGGFYKNILNYGAMYPLSVLLIQKPTRLIYKAALNREPVVDRPPPTFWDAVYMILLFLGFAALPFIIMDTLTK